MSERMKAGEFKAKCLKVMDRVKKTGRKIIIRKRNKPVAQLVPMEEKEESLFGAMKGTIHVLGDIITPVGEEWEVR